MPSCVPSTFRALPNCLNRSFGWLSVGVAMPPRSSSASSVFLNSRCVFLVFEFGCSMPPIVLFEPYMFRCRLLWLLLVMPLVADLYCASAILLALL